MKIVLVGLGKVGRNILKKLATEHYDVVVIDEEEEKIQSVVDKYDVRGLCGNGCDADNLEEAGMDNTDVFLAMTDSDEQNVLCSLMAKSLGAKHTVARVREPEYSAQADFFHEKLGIDKLVNPDKVLADEIARVLRFPSVEKIYSFANGKVEIVEVYVSAGSELVGKRLCELGKEKRNFSILIAAIERDGQITVPNGNTVLQEGDVMSVCAKHLEICDFLKAYRLLKKKYQDIMILGSNRIAFYLAEALEKNGFCVKLISPNHEKCSDLLERLNNVEVVCDDFTNSEVLDAEAIEDAEAVVATTDYDENNIMLSLYAQSKNVDKVITVSTNDSYSGILDSIDLDNVVSPYQVVADETFGYIRSISVPVGSRMEALYKIADEGVEAIQFSLNGHKAFKGKALKDLHTRLRPGVLIAAVIHGKTVIIPNGSTEFSGDETIIVITTKGNVSSLEDVLR